MLLWNECWGNVSWGTCRATREGFEYQTGVNYFGHVELAKQLIERLMLGQVGRRCEQSIQVRIMLLGTICPCHVHCRILRQESSW